MSEQVLAEIFLHLVLPRCIMSKKQKGARRKMGQEYELKYRATQQELAQIQARWPGAWQTIRMETTYYSTPSGKLEQLRCTLRSRLENGVCVCTLKTPAVDGVRGEWELECDRIEEAVPELCKLSGWEELAFLLKEPLYPTCGARFTRLAKTVTLPECTLELALDRGVLTGAGRELPLAEVEVELKTGSRAGADTFAAALATEFSLEVQPESKFRRALRLYKGEEHG